MGLRCLRVGSLGNSAQPHIHPSHVDAALHRYALANAQKICPNKRNPPAFLSYNAGNGFAHATNPAIVLIEKQAC